MTTETLTVGDVFSYAFLWHWQHQRGETEGRKTRPSCVALLRRSNQGLTVLFIVPITSRPPQADRIALQVPPLEAKRAGLDTDKSLWVIADEINADALEQSWYIEDRTPQGQFSPMFLRSIQAKVGEARAVAKIVSRT